MSRTEFHKQAHYFLALAIAFCLPFAKLTPIFIALMLVNWIIERDFRNKFNTIFKNKLALIFILFYGMHLLGMTYTQNINSGSFDLQVKLSLLIFPLVLASRPLNKENVPTVFFALISGAFISSLILLGRATYHYLYLNDNCFFYSAFSFMLHPSYLSLYLCVALAWMLFEISKNSFTNKWFSNGIAIVLILFFSFINVLLSSKMGLINTILILIGFLIFYIFRHKKYTLGFSGIALIAILMYSVFNYVPAVRDRINNAITSLTTPSVNQTDSESTAVRLLIWKAANQVISENPLLGTGTGDAKDKLMQEYQKRGMTGAIEHKLNTHNEYFQVLVSLGWIGFIVFLLSLFAPLAVAFKTSNSIYALFLLIMILNFIPESMFETQAGVMFYAFFNSLLCFSNNNSSINNL
jgi:O-antigen ligase